MPYGYNPVTHTPEGYARLGKRKPAHKPELIDHELHLRRVLHGYTGATLKEKRAAFETLQNMGVEI